jgi:hypothetical protein
MVPLTRSCIRRTRSISAVAASVPAKVVTWT